MLRVFNEKRHNAILVPTKCSSVLQALHSYSHHYSSFHGLKLVYYCTQHPTTMHVWYSSALRNSPLIGNLQLNNL